MLTLPASEDFIDGMDRSLGAAGYSNRSQFIRDAIIEKLQRAGIKVPREAALAPGRVPEKYPDHVPSSLVLSEESSSKVDAAASKALKMAEASVKKKAAK